MELEDLIGLLRENLLLPKYFTKGHKLLFSLRLNEFHHFFSGLRDQLLSAMTIANP